MATPKGSSQKKIAVSNSSFTVGSGGGICQHLYIESDCSTLKVGCKQCLAQGHSGGSCWSNREALAYLVCRFMVKIPLVCMTERDNFMNTDRLQGRRAFTFTPTLLLKS